jgi:molybdopterin converting factor small subunit
MKKLSLPLNDFADVIEGNRIYVDKTKFLLPLIENKGFYFLSRPRRFGKSLLLSTFKYIFQGRKDLFKGLYIEDKIEWKTYPVIYLDFLNISYKDTTLAEGLKSYLRKEAKKENIVLEGDSPRDLLSELITKLKEKYKQNVVILIDEYDKSIVDYIDEPAQAAVNRDTLKNFFGTLKGMTVDIQFIFLTGVSKFSKVSLFSDLNNLTDLTLKENFTTALGYTQEELESYFAEYLEKQRIKKNMPLPDLLAEIKQWYNGYSWNGVDTVYNPYSILNFLDDGEFLNHWFSTGTPTMVVKLLNKRYIEDFVDVPLDIFELERYDITEVEKHLVSLLFQTGYLTITTKLDAQTFLLNYPNKEVRDSFNHFRVAEYIEGNTSLVKLKYNLKTSLYACKMDLFVENLTILFAQIPYQIAITNREAYYQLIIYLTLKILGLEIIAEDNTNKGRIDAVIFVPNYIYIIEFKFSSSTKQALLQIKDKQYYEKYLADDRQVCLVGMNFDYENRTVVECVTEKVEK